DVLQHADEILVNPVILGELRAGFLKGKFRKKNEDDLARFLSSPRVGILPLDEESASYYAVVLNSLWQAGTPIPTNDVWIATSAMQHGARLLTTDHHFLKVQQIIVDHF